MQKDPHNGKVQSVLHQLLCDCTAVTKHAEGFKHQQTKIKEGKHHLTENLFELCIDCHNIG